MSFVFANVIQDAFSPLINLFESILVFIHNNIVGGSWGLSIIGLTVVVRAVLVPLTISQFRSMGKMQQIQPQMKALQERYKGDRQRQSEELMKLYRENGVNPFASCLPLLLQLPVFISLFYMLRKNLKADICGPQLVQLYNHTKGTHLLATKAQAGKLPGSFLQSQACNHVAHHSAKFLFIPDITAKTTGVTLVVLLVLYVGSQLGSSLVMTVTADPTQRRIMLALPLFFTLFIFSFPGGLLVYWITTNLWTLGQSLAVRRLMGHPAQRPGKEAEPGGEPVSTNGGGEAKPVLAGVAAAGRAAPAPPPPPRKRKKRSGRRR